MAPPDPRFLGKQLPTSRFAGDDGAATPAVEAALAGGHDGVVDLYAVQRALLGTRLLIPTAATVDEIERDEHTGHTIEKASHLSVVTFDSSAGWSGLLAFTSVEAASRWDPAARPVPVTASEAAAAALEDGRSVLVLDLAGPHRLALSGTVLRALAMERPAMRPAEDPEVLAAIGGVLGEQRAQGIDGWTVTESAEADLTVVLRVTTGGDPVAVAHAAAEALAVDPLIRDRCERGIAFGIAAP